MAYLKDFHKQLGDRGLLDGKPHILLLDGHASHVSVEVVRLAMNLKIILFQLPSRTSHITQPLDVVAFGRFKKSVARVLACFYHNSGGLLPLKRDMPGVIADAWKVSFTPEMNKSSFAGAGLWPVNMEGRLKGTAKKKERRDERPPLQDVPIAAPNEQLGNRHRRKDPQGAEGARAHRHGNPSRHGVTRWPLDSKEAREEDGDLTGLALAFPTEATSPRLSSWTLLLKKNAQTRRRATRKLRGPAKRRGQKKRPRSCCGGRAWQMEEGDGGGEEGGGRKGEGAAGTEREREGDGGGEEGAGGGGGEASGRGEGGGGRGVGRGDGVAGWERVAGKGGAAGWGGAAG
ncbi:transposase [Ectocarpus siliculosus]|uniref:Transposase n=1 Tax=Ectocarpus siliculosus TaxID=2880 RepID=D8LN28_ECTSI|nr:transposase [Ectocarpus siliculosus]|eukprot:CBN74791.1 transposase [Ectocarpus siliculosus]